MRSAVFNRYTPALYAMTFGLVLGGVSLEGCGGDDGSGSKSVELTPAEKMCKAVKDSVTRCGGGTCDQALVADCQKLAAVLSDPYLEAAADCMTKGGAALSCLGSSISALAPTPGQEAFVKKFCDECPPLPIPGCEDALLGKGNVPEQLKSVKQLFSPFGDEVLQDVEQQCFGGLKCIAEISTCVQKVLAARAVPTNTIQCALDALVSGGASSGAAPKCAAEGGAGTGGQSSGGSGGTGGGETGGGGSGGVGTGGGETGGSGGSGASGGSGGTGGTTSGSCVGYCGGQAPSGCYCDNTCDQTGDCCADKQSACGGGTGGTGGGGTGGTGGSDGGSTCTGDSYEPNDSSSSPKVIDTGGDGKLSDCEPSQTLLANVGDGDIDWYKFTGVDGPCGFDSIQPHAKVTASTNLTVCIYLKPLGGSGPPKCTKGTSDSGVSGYTGCCGTNEARMDFGSNFADDSATVLIKVANPGSTCTAYNMNYGYGSS